MAGNTPWYHLAFFDFGDRLDAQINVQREVDRFISIDKQLYGLYNVFGNGVINGWEVYNNGFSTNDGISIGITTGRGIINYIASQTVVPQYLIGLVPNSTLYIYAALRGSTVSNRYVSFIVSSTDSDQINVGSLLIKIAEVVTGENGVSTIDNTVKTYIDFEQSILNAINVHKHRGTPSKIDLTREVKNQLPGARIEGFDASSITSGRLPEDRIPVINHLDLDNAGILTHSQIDTMINELTGTSVYLFGSVATTDFLKQTTFLKYMYPTVDKYFFNELCIIPGISASSQADYVYTTAFIDRTLHRVIGLPVDSGDTYFYTSNFSLPSKPVKVFLTSSKVVPASTSVTFGVNSDNSVDFDNYSAIIENSINSISVEGSNLRVGIKFNYGGPPTPPDPYSVLFEDFIDFGFSNDSATDNRFHFRIRFYLDSGLSDLYHTSFSQSDQAGWIVDDTYSVPSIGYEVVSGDTILITYYPDLNIFDPNVFYYMVIDVWDGVSFVNETAGYMFMRTAGSNVDPYAYLPRVNNFAIIFELENKELVLLNL